MQAACIKPTPETPGMHRTRNHQTGTPALNRAARWRALSERGEGVCGEGAASEAMYPACFPEALLDLVQGLVPQ